MQGIQLADDCAKIICMEAANFGFYIALHKNYQLLL